MILMIMLSIHSVMIFIGAQIANNGLTHGEVPAYNNAELLFGQAESSELDGTILLPTPSPSGNLGRRLFFPLQEKEGAPAFQRRSGGRAEARSYLHRPGDTLISTQ